MDKTTFLKRARLRRGHPWGFWGKVAAMMEKKPGIGVADRGAYSPLQWNFLEQAKAQLSRDAGEAAPPPSRATHGG